MLPVDLAANAASLGVKVLKATTLVELKDALAKAKASETAVLVHVDTDLEYQSPGGDGWWDVPVAEISELDFTQEAREHLRRVQGHSAPPALTRPARPAPIIFGCAAEPAPDVTAVTVVNHFIRAAEVDPRGYREGTNHMTTITDPEALPSADNDAAPGELTTVPHWKGGAPFAGDEHPDVRRVRPGDRAG